MEPIDLWTFLPIGYAATVTVELPILLVALSTRHPRRARIVAGFWLTACTYSIVVLVLPMVLLPEYSEATYLIVAETFAPLAECGLFWLAYGERTERFRPSMWRDFAAITVANLASFAIGEVLNHFGWFGLA